MLFDSGADDNRILIYTTAQNLKYLATCNQWLCDRTFRAVPKIFTQLYTFRGYKKRKSVPLVYAIAPNKSEMTYSIISKTLKNANKKLKPKWVMINFELAFMHAFQRIFPNTEISGYLFHFGQCLWRRLQSNGQQALCNNDAEYSLNVRMLMALPFVSINDVIDAYNMLIKTDYYDNHDAELSQIIDYFEESWIKESQP